MDRRLTELCQCTFSQYVKRKNYAEKEPAGTRMIFSRGGQISFLETKVPQRGPGIEPRWGHGGKVP